jgi:hypothetical protein
MTFEEMERGLSGVQDNLTAQGAIMHRLENNLDRLEAIVAQNTDAVRRNAEAIQHLANGQALMQSSVHALFERLDRFIRGLESDGHKKKGKA